MMTGSSSDVEAAGSTRSLTYVAPGRAELRDWQANVDPGGRRDTMSLDAVWSGISRGTERLVFQGRVPESEHRRMRAPFQQGDFPFPVAYGYSWVGRAEEGGGACHYFGLFPHRERVVAPVDALLPLPKGLPPRRAVLGANMETALNVAWDSGAGPGDRIAIVGGGVLGLLVAGLLANLPGSEVVVVDIDESRRSVAERLGADFALPGNASGERDMVIHTSASETGIETALALAGTEAVVVEASWYGPARPSVPFGEAFHSKRLTLRSSQVGMVSTSRRVRWDHRRRLAMALRLLADDKYDALITGEVAFEALPEKIGTILDPAATGLATAVAYSEPRHQP